MMNENLALGESVDSRMNGWIGVQGLWTRVSLAILVVAGLAGAHLSCTERDGDESEAAVFTDTLSYLALGDSYTIGEGVDSIQRWPVQLSRALTEDGIPVQEPRIIAQTGWTTDELDQGILEAEVTGPFDLVSLLIGVNNQYRGRDLTEYRLQLRELIRTAVEFAGGNPGRVLVLSIPDWGVTPFAVGRDREAITREIDAFNGVKQEESRMAGVAYVDVTGISREAVSSTELVAGDGLHPSGAMYARWVEAALPTVLTMLKRE